MKGQVVRAGQAVSRHMEVVSTIEVQQVADVDSVDLRIGNGVAGSCETRINVPIPGMVEILRLEREERAQGEEK